MELILKQDVENLGFKDDVLTVKPGYARNFLIPQGFATLATPSAKKVLEENLRQRAHKEAKLIEDAKKTAEALASLELKITVKAGTGNKLFGSVTTMDLADHLSKNGHSIDRKFIQIMGGSIKTIGRHTAKIRLHREVIIDFAFDVAGEQK